MRLEKASGVMPAAAACSSGVVGAGWSLSQAARWAAMRLCIAATTPLLRDFWLASTAFRAGSIRSAIALRASSSR